MFRAKPIYIPKYMLINIERWVRSWADESCPLADILLLHLVINERAENPDKIEIIMSLKDLREIGRYITFEQALDNSEYVANILRVFNEQVESKGAEA
jgi:hypothetical protein